MYPSYCSGNFSSRSLGSSLRCPGSSCGSSRPSTPVPSRGLCSPRRYPWGPSLRRGCQVTCWEPSSCRPSCCSPRVPTLGSLCWAPPPRALGWGSKCSYSLSSGSGGLRPLGYRACGVPALSSASRFCCRTYGTTRSCLSRSHQASCGSSVC